MDSYDLDSILSLDKNKRTHDRDSEDSEPDEVGFSKVGRFTKRQRRDQVSFNGYESDSFDEDDSDDDTGEVMLKNEKIALMIAFLLLIEKMKIKEAHHQTNRLIISTVRIQN